MRVPEAFKRQINFDTKNCLLFVGAGLSTAMVRARGRTLPDWNTLTLRMIRELKNKVSGSTLSELRAQFHKKEYLDIAQEFKKLTRNDAYALFLRDQLDPPDFVRTQIHETLLAIEFKGIITTNFDRVIEFHTDRFRPLIYPHFLEEPWAFQRERFLAKIHGCISTPNPAKNLVLTKNDYLRLRKNEKYQELMKSLFLGNAILVVGFSLTDPDFLGVIKNLRRIFSEQLPTMYVLTRRPTRPQRDSWRAKGLEIIGYEEHKDLGGFFADLLKISESKYPSMRLNTSPQVYVKVRDIKSKAWLLYSNWKKTGSISPRFGIVRITVKGWHHLTRASRPQAEVCHKLTLLGCAREVVEKSKDSILVRSLKTYRDGMGRIVERELHVIRGQSLSRFRADIWVDVVLEVKRLKIDKTIIDTSFYSVYERRN